MLKTPLVIHSETKSAVNRRLVRLPTIVDISDILQYCIVYNPGHDIAR